MKTTSALLGIIGGLLGIVTGYWIQTVGGINSFFEIDNADTTIVIGNKFNSSKILHVIV